MKILYASGNRVGAGVQAARIISNLKGHDVKVAGYVSAFDFLPSLDWCLNALEMKKNYYKKINQLLGHQGCPIVNIKNLKHFIDDICFFEPDLIINDSEPITAHIAQTLDIKLWYCSPLYLIDGLYWGHVQKRNVDLLEKTNFALKKMPKAERTYIYTPFNVQIRDKYKIITPYYNSVYDIVKPYNLAIIPNKEREPKIKLFLKHYSILSCSPDKNENYNNQILSAKTCIIDGDTSYLSDCLFNNKKFCTIPVNNGVENLLNANVADSLGYSKNFGQVEYLRKDGILAIKNYIKNDHRYQFKSNNQLFLHEEIEKI